MHIRNLITRGLFAAALSVTALTAPTAHAVLLTSADEIQIEGWLGLGDMTFTTIYNPARSAMSNAGFHAAADGQGATITLLSVGPVDSSWNTPNQIIGGYNPQSWNSSNSYNVTSSDAERTAFLFNLTEDSLLRQVLTTEANLGQYQTYNASGGGPTWGAGHDIYTLLNGYASSGHAVDLSYGGASANDPITFGATDGNPRRDNFYILEIQVLTFSSVPQSGGSAVPDTGGTLGLLGLGLCLLGFAGVRGLKGFTA